MKPQLPMATLLARSRMIKPNIHGSRDVEACTRASQSGESSALVAASRVSIQARTSDLDCTDDSNGPNHWDVKLFRANGQVHYCGNLSESEPVSIDAPDLCFH